jgi:hypothetical protein
LPANWRWREARRWRVGFACVDGIFCPIGVFCLELKLSKLQ